jgi:hypothetical protein
MMNAHGCVRGFFVLFVLGRGGERWWVSTNGEKRENGLDIRNILKK